MGKKFDPSHVDRIAAKMRSDDESRTKSYATTAFLSVQQTKIARKPRQSALNALIEKIKEGDPNITDKRLLRELEKRKGEGVIVGLTADDQIVWKGFDGKERMTPVSGLKDRLSREKNKPKSS